MENSLQGFISCLLEEREALEDALYSDKHNPPPQDQSGWKQSHVATLLASIRPVYGSSELDRRRESAVKELLAVGIPPADAVARCAQARDAHERLIGYCIEAAGQHNSVLDGDINTDHAAAIEALCDLLPVVAAPATTGKEQADDTATDWTGEAERIALAVGDTHAAEIMRIASSNLSADKRMAAIIRIDPRMAAKDSPAWETLLDVSNVRGLPTWDAIQRAKGKR